MSPRNEREAHSLLGAATDSELDRWLEAADRKKAKADHQLCALGMGVCLLVCLLIGLVVVGSVMLIFGGCA